MKFINLIFLVVTIIQLHYQVIIYFNIKEDGIVYSFGYNIQGQLGLSNNDSKNIPTEIKYLSDKNIIGVNCGYHHTIALSSNYLF